MDKKAIKGAKKIIKDNLEKLNLLRDQGYEEFASDFRNIDSGLIRLQSTLAAFLILEEQIAYLFDIATPPPSDDYFYHLKEGGHITKEKRRTYEQMISFRERVNKLSQSMKPKILFDILTDELENIEHFEKNLLAILKTHKKGK